MRESFLKAALLCVGLAATASLGGNGLMPRVEDYTHMWWAEGFPAHSPDAPWLRVIQTGVRFYCVEG